MENSLLQREKDLFKLNIEINAKTQDVFDKCFENKTTLKKLPASTRSTPENVFRQKNDSSVNRRSCVSSLSSTENSLKKGENKALLKSERKKSKANNLPSAGVVPKIMQTRNVSSDGMVKFLKAKAAILQTELDTAQEEHEIQTKQFNEVVEKLKQSFNLREQSNIKNVALDKVVVKFERKNIELQKKVQQHEDVIKNLTKELNATKCQLKSSHNSKQSLEKKCAKAQEECEELKNKLKCCIDLEKEMRDSTRQERSTMEEQIKDLRKQRIDMLQAYKKQLILIDKLKRQKLNSLNDSDDDVVLLMESAEKEFIKFLDNGM